MKGAVSYCSKWTIIIVAQTRVVLDVLIGSFGLRRQYFTAAAVKCAAIEATPPKKSVIYQSCICIRRSRHEHVVGEGEVRADGSRLTKTI